MKSLCDESNLKLCMCSTYDWKCLLNGYTLIFYFYICPPYPSLCYYRLLCTPLSVSFRLIFPIFSHSMTDALRISHCINNSRLRCQSGAFDDEITKLSYQPRGDGRVTKAKSSPCLKALFNNFHFKKI